MSGITSVRTPLVKTLALCTLLGFTAAAQAAELKLVRFGPVGQEKPGLVDDGGQLRDLSAHISDIGPEQLSDEALEQIAAIPLDQLPLVQGDPRLGVPLTGIGKIIAIGFN